MTDDFNLQRNKKGYDGPAVVFVGQLACNGPLLEYWEMMLRQEYERGCRQGVKDATDNKEV